MVVKQRQGLKMIMRTANRRIEEIRLWIRNERRQARKMRIQEQESLERAEREGEEARRGKHNKRVKRNNPR
jgi:hypothetical protein